MTKLSRFLIMFISVLGVCSLFGLVGAPSAHAAPAICYSASQGGTGNAGTIVFTALDSCSGVFLQAYRQYLLNPDPPETPATQAFVDAITQLPDNMCFALGTDLKFGDAGSQRCNRFAQSDQDVATGATPLNTSSLEDPVRNTISNCTAGADCLNNNPIVVLAKLIINTLSAFVAVVVVIVIILGGIQYSSSGGNPGKAADAKKHIINAIIALVAYMLLFVGFQWLIPGGLL